MLKSKQTTYNDGVCDVFRPKDIRTDFSARLNPKALDDLDYIVRLSFAEKSCRIDDIEMAERLNFSLSRKIQVRNSKMGIDQRCMVVIGEYMYSISYLDVTPTDLYLYLQEVRKLEPLK